MNLKGIRIEGDSQLAALLRGTVEQVLSGNLYGARPLLDMLEDQGDRQAPRLRHLYDKLAVHQQLHVEHALSQDRKSCAICDRGGWVWFISRFDGIAKALAARCRQEPLNRSS